MADFCKKSGNFHNGNNSKKAICHGSARINADKFNANIFPGCALFPRWR
jgi:hypothetical protein